MNNRIVLASNTSWNISNHRLGLAQALIAEGYEVVAVAPQGSNVSEIEAAGLRFVPLAMDRKGMNPLDELLLLWRMTRLLRRERPAAFLGFTIKPNVYGGLACKWLGIPAIHNVAGLGFAFARRNALSSVASMLYRWAFKRARVVFFQNEQDRQMMVEDGVVNRAQTARLPGSGVDTVHFAPRLATETAARRPFRALLCSRLLREKGIAEFAEAARRLRAEGRDVEFQLLGPFDDGNPSALSPDEVARWQAAGLLHYVGNSHDVRPFLASADVVVLPSYYREGVPRILLEAASMGRPIVTTDWVGCREAVVDGETGFLCAPRDPVDLAAKIARVIDLPAADRARMSVSARAHAVTHFDESIVIAMYVDMLSTLGSPSASPTPLQH